jgi:acetyl esterase
VPEVPVPAAEARAFLLDPSRPDTSWFGGDVATLRARQAELFAWARGAPAAVASVREIEARGVPARLHRPRGDETGVLVWCHGGGWVIGDVDGYDDLARAIAVRSGCAVLSVEYRRAPEHRHPAAADDCWAATLWASDAFARVAVGGDSAGGNLAAVVAHRARDERIALAMQLLVYPMTDWRPDSASYAEFAARYRGFAGFPRFGAEAQDVIRDCWDQYVPDPARRRDRDAAPLRAARFDGLAPALMVLAEHDILRAEGEEYAERLRAAGVPVDVITYPGQIHGFYPLLGRMADARDAVERSATALRAAMRMRGRHTEA